MGEKQCMNLVAGKGGSKARRMRDAGLPIGRDIFLGGRRDGHGRRGVI